MNTVDLGGDLKTRVIECGHATVLLPLSSLEASDDIVERNLGSYIQGSPRRPPQRLSERAILAHLGAPGLSLSAGSCPLVFPPKPSVGRGLVNPFSGSMC